MQKNYIELMDKDTKEYYSILSSEFPDFLN